MERDLRKLGALDDLVEVPADDLTVGAPAPVTAVAAVLAASTGGRASGPCRVRLTRAGC